MARKARKKDLNGTYHIIIRSISEILLFKNDNDKEQMLKLIRKYQKIFGFKLLSFCLMDTHAHFMIECNGADISKFMHGINLSYAIYYNKKYDRHGHVFSDRFKSISLNTNCSLLNCSAYIHNNPKDIHGFKNNVENYPYSSLSIYIGITEDKYKIINTSRILKMIDNNILKGRKQYYNFVKSRTDTPINDDISFGNYNIESEYENKDEKHLLVNNVTPEDILSFVSNYTHLGASSARIKFNHKASTYRALCCILMKSLCDFKSKDICSYIGNISLSTVSQLYNKGYHIIENNPKYKNIIHDFIETYSS